MTALIGSGDTINFTDDWVYDQAVNTYALDKENELEGVKKEFRI